MSDANIECLTQLNFSFAVFNDWNNFQEILVNHHCDTPVVASHEKAIGRVNVNAVSVPKKAFADKFGFLFVFIECQ